MSRPRARFLLILLAACVAFFSVSPVAVTSAGRQCPTAAIQMVSVPIKSCCGKIVGYRQRAPKPGEAGFVQCRCAEKQAGFQRASVSPKAPLYLPVEAPELLPAARLDPPAALATDPESVADVARPTLFRPPSFA